MAAKKRSNWFDFYSKYGKADPIGIGVFSQNLASLDADCLSITGVTAALFNRVEENPTANALLVPATAKGVLNVVHNCFWDEQATGGGQIVGVHGLHFTSPWKQVIGDRAVKPLAPTTSAVKAGATIPSLKLMLAVDTPEEFGDLSGEPGGKYVTDLKLLPNVTFLHPALLLTCVESGSVMAKELAYKITVELASRLKQNPYGNDGDSDDEASLEDKAPGQVYQILKYLWAIARGYGRSITLLDPSLSLEGVETCEEKLEEPNFWLSSKTAVRANELPANRKVASYPKGRRSPDDSDGSSDSVRTGGRTKYGRGRDRPGGLPSSRARGHKRSRSRSVSSASSPSSDSDSNPRRRRIGRKEHRGRHHRNSSGSDSQESDDDSDRRRSRRGHRRKKASSREGRGKDPDRRGRRKRSSSRESRYKDPNRRGRRKRSSSRESRDKDSGRKGLRRGRLNDSKDSSESSFSPITPGGEAILNEGLDPRNSSDLQTMLMNNQNMMMQQMTMFAGATLRQAKKSDKAKSMFSKMAEDDERLFDLLAAEDWDDDYPQMSSFMMRIVKDKDVSVAWQSIRKATVDWPGFISEKQVVKFFRTGYLATDIDTCPGGFTLFMFRPTDHPVARSSKEGQNLLRSMFGESKLDDETIKFFAESEFFIASKLAELEDQIVMGIKTMDLFTRPKSIGSDALRYGLKLLQDNRPMFARFFKEDPLFGARYAQLLDKVTQAFAKSLAAYAHRKYPIRSAKRTLRYFAKAQIKDCMRGFRMGVAPNLILPPELTISPNLGTAGRAGDTQGGRPARKPHQDKEREGQNEPTWWSSNPQMVAEWGIPEGKRFGDFFDSKNTDTKENLKGWPKFKHHRLDTQRPMCLKYQSTGRCKGKCYMSHTNPSTMEEETRRAITTKYKLVYE